LRNRQAGLLALLAAGTLSCADHNPVAPSTVVPIETRAGAAGSGSASTAANTPPTLVVRTTPAADYSTNPPTIKVSSESLNVFFGLCQSSDPDEGDSLNWQYNFGDGGRPAWNADGTFNPDHEHECRAEHQYREGTWTAWVTVTDKHLEDQSRGDVSAKARKSQQFTIVAAKEEARCDANASFNTGFEGFASETFVENATIPGVSMTGAAIIIDTGVEPEFFPPPFSGNIVIGFSFFDPPFPELKPNSRAADFSRLGRRFRAAPLRDIPPLEFTFNSDQSFYRFDGATFFGPFVVTGFDASGAQTFTHTFSPPPPSCECELIPQVISGAGKFRKLRVTALDIVFFMDNLSTEGACK